MLDQRRPALNLGDRFADQRLDFLRRLRTALGEPAHLARHHGKATALFARARRFDGRVQREDVGLEGDAVDHRNDLGDLVRALRDAAHLVDHLVDHFAAARGRLQGGFGEGIGFPGVIGVLAHRGGQFLHARRGFFERCRLVLGASRQIGIAGGDFVRAEVDRVGGFTHGLHGARHARLHFCEAREQTADFIGAARGDRLVEAPLRNAVEVTAGFFQRRHHTPAQGCIHRKRPDDQQQQDRDTDAAEQGHAGIDRIERRTARGVAELHEVVRLGEVRVLEALRRLVEKGLDVVRVEKLHQFRERVVQLFIALSERRSAGAVFVAGLLRAHESAE